MRFADEELRRFHYLRAFELRLLSELGNDVGTLIQARALIADLVERSSANERYFLAYARWAGSVAFRRLYQTSGLPAEFTSSADAIPIVGIHAGWKRRFPILLGEDGEPIDLGQGSACIPHEVFGRPRAL